MIEEDQEVVTIIEYFTLAQYSKKKKEKTFQKGKYNFIVLFGTIFSVYIELSVRVVRHFGSMTKSIITGHFYNHYKIFDK